MYYHFQASSIKIKVDRYSQLVSLWLIVDFPFTSSLEKVATTWFSLSLKFSPTLCSLWMSFFGPAFAVILVVMWAGPEIKLLKVVIIEPSLRESPWSFSIYKVRLLRSARTRDSFFQKRFANMPDDVHEPFVTDSHSHDWRVKWSECVRKKIAWLPWRHKETWETTRALRVRARA